MHLALDLAREHGSGWVAVRQSTHYGAAAFYLQAALDRQAIGWTTTNSPPNMPPWGGRKPYLGTNPLAVAIPGGEQGPIVLDMATSVVAKGKVQLMEKEGKTTTPPGWALDGDGNPTQDVQAILNGGMMLPLGGPKGYGLALMVEVLSAMLSSADFGPHLGNMYRDFDRPQNIGHFFGALDIASFLPPDVFAARIDRLIRELKAVPRAPGCDEILVPGEIERRCEARYRVEGIPLDADVYAEICRIAADRGVAAPEVLSLG
jgi:LDH2 family malate/lactate/ureidoglycolate dehydrogenase